MRQPKPDPKASQREAAKRVKLKRGLRLKLKLKPGNEGDINDIPTDTLEAMYRALVNFDD
jgi:hypothetical protein